jgi:hypothetical protein
MYAPDEIVAITMGSQVRALDHALLLAQEHFGPPLVSDFLDEDLEVMVVPRRFGRSTGTLRQGQQYTKRGLQYHRIIPTEIDGCEVELIFNDSLSASSQTVLGAALFKNLQLDELPIGGDKGFIVQSVQFDGGLATIKEHIDGALSDSCFCIVWPELTISPSTLSAIQTELSGRARATDDRFPPEIVVAGSWHTSDGDHYVNRASVLDGYGNLRFSYDKIDAYVDKKLGPEGILRGRKLPVLMTDHLLVGFGICKDFANFAVSGPYSRLDIDLVLVPSLGDEKTLQGHKATASSLQAKFGTRAFVVQQENPPKGSFLGSIIPASKRPSRSARQTTVWRAYKMPQ